MAQGTVTPPAGMTVAEMNHRAAVASADRAAAYAVWARNKADALVAEARANPSDDTEQAARKALWHADAAEQTARDATAHLSALTTQEQTG